MIKLPGEAEEWEVCGTRQSSPAVPKASRHPQSEREKPAGAGTGPRSEEWRRVENCYPFSIAFKQLNF